MPRPRPVLRKARQPAQSAPAVSRRCRQRHDLRRRRRAGRRGPTAGAAGICSRQPADRHELQTLQRNPLTVALSDAEQQHDALDREATAHECKYGNRLVVDPLGVVGDTQQWSAGGSCGEQRRRGRPTRNRSGGGGPSTSPNADSMAARCRAGRSRPATVEERQDEPMHHGEGEVSLRLVAGDPGDLEVHARRALGIVEQCRLADPGLSGQDERTAHAPTRGLEQSVQSRTFSDSTDDRHHVEFNRVTSWVARPELGPRPFRWCMPRGPPTTTRSRMKPALPRPTMSTWRVPPLLTPSSWSMASG